VRFEVLAREDGAARAAGLEFPRLVQWRDAALCPVGNLRHGSRHDNGESEEIGAENRARQHLSLVFAAGAGCHFPCRRRMSLFYSMKRGKEEEESAGGTQEDVRFERRPQRDGARRRTPYLNDRSFCHGAGFETEKSG